jgi:hypothetical protein
MTFQGSTKCATFNPKNFDNSVELSRVAAEQHVEKLKGFKL